MPHVSPGFKSASWPVSRNSGERMGDQREREREKERERGVIK